MNKIIEDFVSVITRKLTCSKIEKEDIADEMRDHLYTAFDTFVATGFTNTEAAHKAISHFGDTTLMQEHFQQVVDPLYGWVRKLAIVGFVIYSVIGLWIVLIFRFINRILAYYQGWGYNPYIFTQMTDKTNNIFFDFSMWQDNLNYIPFHTILLYLGGYVNTNVGINNIVGNLLLLLPLGFLGPFLLKRYQTFLRIIALAFVSSIGIEIIQFVLQIGRADIDDVILNTVGAGIGFTLYKLVRLMLTMRFKISRRKQLT